MVTMQPGIRSVVVAVLPLAVLLPFVLVALLGTDRRNSLEALLPFGLAAVPVVAGLAIRLAGSWRSWRATVAVGGLAAGLLVAGWWVVRVNGECLSVPEPVAAIGVAAVAGLVAVAASWVVAKIAQPRGSAARAWAALIVGSVGGFVLVVFELIGLLLLYPGVLNALGLLAPNCEFIHIL